MDSGVLAFAQLLRMEHLICQIGEASRSFLFNPGGSGAVLEKRALQLEEQGCCQGLGKVEFGKIGSGASRGSTVMLEIRAGFDVLRGGQLA